MSGTTSGYDDFDAFVASGTIEESGAAVAAPKAKVLGDDEIQTGGSKPAASEEPPAEEKPTKPAKRAAKPAATPAAAEEPAPGEKDDDEPVPAGEDDEPGEDGEKPAKPAKKASDRIRELNKRLRDSERLRVANEEELTRLRGGEKPAGQSAPAGDKPNVIGDAPDPEDTAKYPFGHLDGRYIEDKLEWLAEKKAADRADAALQRQQERELAATVERQQEILLERVDTLSEKGSALYDDFHEAVVETGLKGEWPLQQVTFEAAHEAENGAQILYELSQDKAEATRVAGLSPLGQLKFVEKRDAEIAAERKPRTAPKAGEPPVNLPRGASSRSEIRGDTDNLIDFEKLWLQDEKKNR